MGNANRVETRVEEPSKIEVSKSEDDSQTNEFEFALSQLDNELKEIKKIVENIKNKNISRDVE